MARKGFEDDSSHPEVYVQEQADRRVSAASLFLVVAANASRARLLTGSVAGHVSRFRLWAESNADACPFSAQRRKDEG
jgi:hypothetical protein